MASIIVLVIMAGCAAALFLKGNFVRAFATFMAALCADIVAFGWFDQLSGMLIKNDVLPNWAQAVCFIALFVIAFAILMTLVIMLTRAPIDLGTMPEQAGRIICGLLLGYILSGTLLAICDIAPLSAGFPYQRLDASRPDMEKPSKPILNPDGFIMGLFGITSSGSLAGSQSFADLHPDFLNQLFLNRILANKKVSIRTEQGTIETPSKAAAWPAANLKDSAGNALPVKPGFDLINVRIGFTNKLLRAGSSFTTGQVQLLCESKGEKQPLRAGARRVYPLGYIKTPGRISQKGHSDTISLQQSDFQTGTKFIDFAFYIPSNTEPAAIIFKSSDVALVHGFVTAEEAPKPMPFLQASDATSGFAKIKPPAPLTKIYGVELKSGPRLLESATPEIAGQVQWQAMQTAQSIQPAQFEYAQISCVRAELQKPSDANQSEERQQTNKLPRIFKVPSGYQLLSLKCNNPVNGVAITGDELPVLVDLDGGTHYSCGIVATAKIGGNMTYEIDYCPTNPTDTASKSYPDNIWIAEKAQNVQQFNVLYLVKPGTLLVSVRPGGSQAGVAFDGVEMYQVK